MELKTDAVKVVRDFLSRKTCERLIREHHNGTIYRHLIEGQKKYSYTNPEDNHFLMGIEFMLELEIRKYIEENSINNFGKFKAGDFKLMNYYKDCWLVEHYDGDFSKWPEGGYKYHPITIDIALNDSSEYEGGELSMCGEILKMNVGDMAIFPSSFAFPHGVSKVTKGNRYVLISEPYALDWGLQDHVVNEGMKNKSGLLSKLLKLLK